MAPSSTPSSHPEPEVRDVDVLFEKAGLVRNLRGKAAGVSLRNRRIRPGRAVREELSSFAPVPRVASNGVQWLPVPVWEKIGWLWHGFSTRKGGFSRAYCAEGAPGELNLGFTAADGR